MQRPNWFLDELAHVGNEHLDPAYVEIYDRKSGIDFTEDLELLRAKGLNEQSTVIDLGTGTGAFALAVAPLCRRVVAVDVSPAMLALLRANAERQGLHNIEIAHAGFLSYEHQGAPADFIYSRNALHHLPDFWKALALRRVAEMLRPDGVLRLHDLVYAFEPDETVPKFAAWFANARERPEEGFTRPELETHVREEYSTFSWLLEPILDHAGFAIEESSYRPSRTYAAYTCVKR